MEYKRSSISNTGGERGFNQNHQGILRVPNPVLLACTLLAVLTRVRHDFGNMDRNTNLIDT